MGLGRSTNDLGARKLLVGESQGCNLRSLNMSVLLYVHCVFDSRAETHMLPDVGKLELNVYFTVVFVVCMLNNKGVPKNV